MRVRRSAVTGPLRWRRGDPQPTRAKTSSVVGFPDSSGTGIDFMNSLERTALTVARASRYGSPLIVWNVKDI